MESIDHLFHLASGIIEADGFDLFLLSEGTPTDEDEYLSSLEDGTELLTIFLWRLTAFRVAVFSEITLMLLKRYKPFSKYFF